MAKEVNEGGVKPQVPTPVQSTKQVPKHNFKLNVGEAVIGLKASPADQVKIKFSEWASIYEKAGTWDLIDNKTSADEKKLS